MRKALFVTFITAACSGSGESVSELEQRAESVNDCCTVERSAIGKENHLVRLGSNVVLIHDWVPKAGEPGKYSGFSMTVSNNANMKYLVKAGTRTHNESQDSFSSSDPIVYVDLCGNCDNPDGCDGGGGGGDGGGGGGGGGDGSGDPACPGGDCPTNGGDGWDGPL